MSDTLMKILILSFVILCIVAVCEKRYVLALYWFGAIVVNIAICIGLTK